MSFPKGFANIVIITSTFFLTEFCFYFMFFIILYFLAQLKVKNLRKNAKKSWSEKSDKASKWVIHVCTKAASGFVWGS